MLSLQQINAFSLKKGCYPGQEIVARTHYLGKSKRGLFAVTGENLQPGTPLFQESREVGRVANSSYDGSMGVAVLNAGIPPGSTLDGSVIVGEAVSAA
jgi:folate-binding Fe-S cluster repair protein YgfZ